MKGLLIFWVVGMALSMSAAEGLPVAAAGSAAERGQKLFLLNCAHCHGTDARGDEGPDLHGVVKSDAKLSNIILNGVKGEMPKFSAKLKAEDAGALIAFIRTLKE